MRNTALNNSLGSFGKQSKDTEIKLIFKALHLYKQPLSRRKLSEVTDLEIATLCRALHNLANRSKSLKVAKTARCPKTGKQVYHYYFVKTGGQNGK